MLGEEAAREGDQVVGKIKWFRLPRPRRSVKVSVRR